LLIEIEEAIGLPFTGKVGLLAFERKDDYASFAARFGEAHTDVLGIYIPASLDPNAARALPQIALNLGLMRDVRAQPSTVLKHELCHAVLDENLLSRHRPLWFEEGVAQWVSETPVEAALGALGYATGYGTDPTSMYELSRLLRVPEERGVAYAHALASIREIEDDFGKERLRDFVVLLNQERSKIAPASFAELFSDHFETPYEEWARGFLESRFRAWYERAFQMIGYDLFSGLMLIGVVLMVIAWVRKRRRDARTLEDMKFQDELYPSDGLWALSSRPEQIVDVDALLAEREAAERLVQEEAEAERQHSHTPPSPYFEDGDGYWTEDGWVQKP
ncbi:MAG: hypothetical protein KDB07_00680, partial [Planctomycetes bacterium]|nr:hypothetical protein [Planctomycetota bacterium]